jgi:acyl carrier protein
VLREDVPGDQRLVAYVVTDSTGGSFSLAEDLRHFVSQKLPIYMVPSAYVCLTALPLTPNGKVDRRSLPLPDAANLTSKPSIDPETPIEAELAALWATVLGVEKIGMQDNFFHLGGHSLLAMQLVSRIRKQFDLELTLAEFFATATVRELAQKIEDAILAKTSDAELDELLDQLEGVGSSSLASP